MKLLFLHRNLPPENFTGVAIQVHRLANALTDLGHDVTVYTHSHQPSDAKYLVKSIELQGLQRALRLAPFLKRLWYPLWYRKLSVVGFDAIHIHGDGGFIQYRGNFVRTFYGTAAMEYRHARTLKGKFAQGFSYWMERREARRCRLTVGISPHVAAHLPGVDRIIPCMLPCEPSMAVPTKTSHPSLLYMGSRNSRKRGGIALDLYGKLKIQFPDITLTYVGHKKEIAELKGISEFQGIEFLTAQNQIAINELYQRSWIYLCFSSYEGFGVGIIEAMAFHTLVLTTPHPGSEYLVRDGETGMVVPIENIEQALIHIIKDDASRNEISRRGREFSKKFTPAVVGSAYAELYRVARARNSGNSK
jgi:glycosyltransferase involved in cell wall biosynthesis